LGGGGTAEGRAWSEEVVTGGRVLKGVFFPAPSCLSVFAFWLPQGEQLCSDMLYLTIGLETLEPADHELETLKS
jgi:hypothetical protein